MSAADLEHEMRQERLHGTAAAAFGTLTQAGRQSVGEHVLDRQALAGAACESGIATVPEIEAEIRATVSAILARHYLDGRLPKMEDDDLRAYLDQHQEMFQTPVELLVRHVVVGSKDEIEAIRARVLSGADFGGVAAEVNTDASRGTGGSLGWIRQGVMQRDFEEVAFGLKDGEVSEPVQTSFGWHLIKVERRRGGRVPALSEIAGRVREAIKRDSASRLASEARGSLGVHSDGSAQEWLQARDGGSGTGSAP